MKKVIAAIALIAVLVCVAVALANTGVGVAYYATTGNKVVGGTVHIHNNSTGANGSTTTDSNGSYIFTGLLSGVSYYVWGEKCLNGNYYVSPHSGNFDGGNTLLPTLFLNRSGSC